MDIRHIAIGIVLIVIFLVLLGPSPLGRLPGDIVIQGKRWTVHAPLMTCLILSVVISVIINVLRRMF